MLHLSFFCSSVKLNEISKFWALNCTKMRLVAGLRPDPLGELLRSPSPPSRYQGMGGEGREGQGRGGRGGEGKGKGKGEGKGHSNPPPKSLATGLMLVTYRY